MKLIDILVRELPNLGGWITGHYQCAQDKTGEVCFYTKGKIHLVRYGMWSISEDSEATHDGESRVVTSLADDYAETIITREQYEAAIAASQRVEWDGVGLPPIGCECEKKDVATGIWYRVTVVYQSEWVTVVREVNEKNGSDLVELAIENYGDERRREFRPIRSEADKKRDEAIKKICEVLSVGKSTEDDAKNIYEYIKSGKIVID